MPPRLSLTRSQLETAVGAELSELLEEVTADGTVDAREVQRVADWLIANQAAKLPAIDHLIPAMHKILADGRVTPSEIDYLHGEIERVMPPELRRGAQLARREARAVEYQRQLAEADAAKRELARLTHVATLDLLVAGVSHEGRAQAIEARLEEIDGAEVRLGLMPDNPYDSNAIAVYLPDGMSLGYIPRGEAAWIAPMLRSGHRYDVRVKKIIEASIPIPVLHGWIYAPDHPQAKGLPAENVPYQRGRKITTASATYEAPESRQTANAIGILLLIVIGGLVAYQILLNP